MVQILRNLRGFETKHPDMLVADPTFGAGVYVIAETKVDCSMRRAAIRLLVLAGLSTGFAATADTSRGVSLDAAAAERFAALALKCLHEEYPSHISHTMDSDADARPPHELTCI